MRDEYVWLIWSSAFLAPWSLLYWRFPEQRRVMVWASIFTAPFALTEPLFVPEYWSPPSLFDLARRTGFDIESVIFCFGIGGVGAVLYDVLARTRAVAVEGVERHHPRHRWHVWALLTPFIVFPALYFLPWNPIYAGIASMVAGSVTGAICRPDLKRRMVAGSGIFLLYYLTLLVGLELTAPGYIERVWNLDALSGVRLFAFPIEELLFAVSFGAYWSGVYEHMTWRRGEPIHPPAFSGTIR